MTMHTQQDDRSLTQLFTDATREASELVRNEIELARLELQENLSRLKASAISMAVAVPLLFGGFLVLLFAAVLALDEVMQRPALSAALVGLAVVVIGLIAFFVGRSGAKKADLVPQRAADSLRRDKEMVQRNLGSSSS